MTHYNVVINVQEPGTNKLLSCRKIVEATTIGDAIHQLIRQCRWENHIMGTCVALPINFIPSYDPFKQVKGPER